MREFFKYFVIALGVMLFIAPQAFSQFSRVSVERLNADTGSTNQTGANIIYTDQGNIVVAWGDDRIDNPYFDIFITISTDAGQSFSDEIKVNDVDGYALIGGEGIIGLEENGSNGLVFCWADKRNGTYNNDIFSRTRHPNGSFSEAQRVNDDSTFFHQYLPSMARVGQSDTLVAVWQDGRLCQSGCQAIFASMSPNGGASWNPNIRADIQDPGIEPCDCCLPWVASGNDGQIMLAFRNNISYFREIYISRAHDDFSTFYPPVRASFGNWQLPACPGTGPVIIQHSSGVWITIFADGRIEPYKIYSSRSTDGGASFDDEMLVGGDYAQNFPRLLELNDGRLLAAFQENIPGQDGNRIVGTISGDIGLNWGPLFELSDPVVSFKSNVQLAYDGINTIYAVWVDTRNGDNDIYFAILESETTGLNEPEQLPKSAFILNAYPNPFNAVCKITVSDPLIEYVNIYNIAGRLVIRLALSGGEAIWDASGHTSGIYFARLEAAVGAESVKMVLLK